ncbi:hypothetical protein AAGG74_18940 [Bacillus mexicanus]
MDKYDLKYGIKSKTKDKMIYFALSIFLLFVLFIFSDKKSVFKLIVPTTSKEAISVLSTVFLFGLVIYLIILILRFLFDINTFKKNNKKLLIRTRVLNNAQKSRIFKKIYIFKELYSIIIKPSDNSYKLDPIQWRYYAKKLGNRTDAVSKSKYIHLLEMKVRDNKPLKDTEIDFLNDLMLESKHLELFQKLKQNSKKRT